MRNALLLFVAVAIALPAVAQVRTPPRPEPANLNFEEGTPGEAPPGWVAPAPGFAARTVESGATAGSKAARLAPIAGRAWRVLASAVKRLYFLGTRLRIYTRQQCAVRNVRKL